MLGARGVEAIEKMAQLAAETGSSALDDLLGTSAAKRVHLYGLLLLRKGSRVCTVREILDFLVQRAAVST